MKFPRFLFNPKARLYFQLWRKEQRQATQFKRERDEWINKFLAKVNTSPLFHTSSPPPPQPERPPIGPSDKRARLSGVPKLEPTDEDILRAADEAERQQANGNG